MPLHLAGGNIEIRLNSSKRDENNTIYAFSLKSAVWSTDCCEFQLIPEISSLSAVTTAVPLFSVLTLTAIKYGYDDIVSGAFYYKVILYHECSTNYFHSFYNVAFFTVISFSVIFAPQFF